MKRQKWKNLLLTLILLNLALLLSCAKKNALERIKESGKITVITRNNAHCYYTYRDNPMGFEYDLAKAFSEYLGVSLKVITPPWEKLFDVLAEHCLGRRLACSHCPVGCIHIAALREPYEDEAYFYKTSMISYDYEPIYALGSMLGISNAEGFLKLMDRIEAWGLDAISTGVVLAWASEAQERRIISEKETMGVKLSWGDYAAYIDAVRLIVEQPNKLYQALGHGVDHAASVYGGEEFALAFGKNEMPGYHTGAAAHIGVLIGARHSHLGNAGYSLDQKVLVKRQLRPEELAEALLAEERWRQVLSSLVICFFARGIYSPDLVSRALHLAGFELTPQDFQEIGEEIHREKYRFKFREGFSLDNIRLPKRILGTPSPTGRLDEGFIRTVVDHVKKTLLSEGARNSL